MNKEKEEILEKLNLVKQRAQEDINKNHPGYEVKDVIYYSKKIEISNEDAGEKEESNLSVILIKDPDTKEVYELYYLVSGEDLENLEIKEVDFKDLLKNQELNESIRDVIDKTKENEDKPQKEQDEELKKDSLEELEAEKEKEEYAEVIEEDEKNISSVAEIENKVDNKKLESMNHLQEIDADTKVSYYKDMEKALNLQGVQKFIVVYSEDAAKLSDSKEQNSSRYSMVAKMDDGSIVNLDDKLEEVKSEGKDSVEGRIQTDFDKKTRVSNNPASIYRIKGSNSNEAFSFENGQYGEIKAYYGNITKTEGSTFVGTQLETSNVWPTSHKLREQVSDRKGEYHADNKKEETEKHLEHGDEEVDIKNSDGEKSTVECESPFVPDTQITWEQFSKLLGDKDIEKISKEFFEQYNGKNGQELVLRMQAEHKEKETENIQKEEKEVEDEYEGRVPWDSAKH